MLKLSKTDWQTLKAHYEFGVPVTKLAARYNISTVTCKRYAAMTEPEFEALESEQQPYLDNYREFILEELKTNPQIQNTNLYYRLEEKFPEFDCRPSTFHRYMQNIRGELGGIYLRKRNTSIRKPLPPGYEAQADFGQMVMMSMYGNKVRVYFFCMVMSYSRMHFVYFSPEPFTTKSAIEAHDYAFRYFGGRPQTIMYDQDRVFVVSENFGNIILVHDFEEYVKSVGYTVVLCRPRDPQTKGKVESFVKFVKESFLDGRLYSGINELNVAAMQWLDTVANAKPNDTTHKAPKDMFAEESSALVKVPRLAIDRVEIRCVSADYKVRYENSIYELPRLAVAPHKQLRIEKKDGKLFFYLLPYGALVYVVDQAEEGAAVPCEDAGVQMESVAEIQLRRQLDGVDIRETFMAELENAVPRYRNSHLRRISLMVEGYGIERVEEAMEYCIMAQNCTAVELAAYLIYKYGAALAKKNMEKNMYYTCKARANGIARERNGRYQ